MTLAGSWSFDHCWFFNHPSASSASSSSAWAATAFASGSSQTVQHDNLDVIPDTPSIKHHVNTVASESQGSKDHVNGVRFQGAKFDIETALRLAGTFWLVDHDNCRVP